MSATIRVLGIAGSPRRHGNTEILLDQFLAGAEAAGAQVHKIVVSQLDFAGCLACGICAREGTCSIKDGFQEVNRRLNSSDVIAIASPLYFWNVPARLKALVDRGQVQWSRKVESRAPLAPSAAGHIRRRGAFICVGGHPRGHFEGTVQTIKSFLGVYEADYWGELLYRRVDAKGAIRDHATALQEAEELGHRATSEPWNDEA